MLMLFVVACCSLAFLVSRLRIAPNTCQRLEVADRASPTAGGLFEHDATAAAGELGGRDNATTDRSLDDALPAAGDAAPDHDNDRRIIPSSLPSPAATSQIDSPFALDGGCDVDLLPTSCDATPPSPPTPLPLPQSPSIFQDLQETPRRSVRIFVQESSGLPLPPDTPPLSSPLPPPRATSPSTARKSRRITLLPSPPHHQAGSEEDDDYYEQESTSPPAAAIAPVSRKRESPLVVKARKRRKRLTSRPPSLPPSPPPSSPPPPSQQGFGMEDDDGFEAGGGGENTPGGNEQERNASSLILATSPTSSPELDETEAPSLIPAAAMSSTAANTSLAIPSTSDLIPTSSTPTSSVSVDDPEAELFALRRIEERRRISRIDVKRPMRKEEEEGFLRGAQRGCHGRKLLNHISIYKLSSTVWHVLLTARVVQLPFVLRAHSGNAATRGGHTEKELQELAQNLEDMDCVCQRCGGAEPPFQGRIRANSGRANNSDGGGDWRPRDNNDDNDVGPHRRRRRRARGMRRHLGRTTTMHGHSACTVIVDDDGEPIAIKFDDVASSLLAPNKPMLEKEERGEYRRRGNKGASSLTGSTSSHLRLGLHPRTSVLVPSRGHRAPTTLSKHSATCFRALV